MVGVSKFVHAYLSSGGLLLWSLIFEVVCPTTHRVLVLTNNRFNGTAPTSLFSVTNLQYDSGLLCCTKQWGGGMREVASCCECALWIGVLSMPLLAALFIFVDRVLDLSQNAFTGPVPLVAPSMMYVCGCRC